MKKEKNKTSGASKSTKIVAGILAAAIIFSVLVLTISVLLEIGAAN